MYRLFIHVDTDNKEIAKKRVAFGILWYFYLETANERDREKVSNSNAQ